jgi:hypothetical protein
MFVASDFDSTAGWAETRIVGSTKMAGRVPVASSPAHIARPITVRDSIRDKDAEVVEVA